MSVRHAAEAAVKASKAVSQSGLALSKSGKYSKEDIRFVRSFIRAALHGHSPDWKRRGWRAADANPLKGHGGENPLRYLSRELVEGESSTNTLKGGKKQPNWIPLKQFRVRTSSNAKPTRNVSQRFYATEATQESSASRAREVFDHQDQPEDLLETEDPDAELLEGNIKGSSEDQQTHAEIPAVSTSALTGLESKKLQPGDYLQVRK